MLPAGPDQLAGEVRIHEAALLRTLSVNQSVVDSFIGLGREYQLLLWQVRQPWVSADRSLAQQVIADMRTVGVSLRKLERTLQTDPGCDSEIQEEAGRLQRAVAARSSLAEELLPLMEYEPAEAVSIFYNSDIRSMRRFDMITASLEFYHSRRPSYRPLSES
jgi:hypothetical protein